MNLQLIISDAYYFFRNHFSQICSLCLPWLLLIAVVDLFITSAGDPSQGILPTYLMALLFNQLIYPIYTAALILLMAKRAQQERPDNKTLLISALRLWQPFFIVHIMSAGLTLMGLTLFIIPGIYVAVRLSFAEFYLVLENDQPLEAILKSFQATRPWDLFFEILLLLLLFLTPLLIINFYITGVLNSQGVGPFPRVMVATITAFFMLFVDVLRFRIFMSVKQGDRLKPFE